MVLLHTTNKKIKKLVDTKQSNICNFKPQGLWYAHNTSWLKFYKEEMGHKKKPKYFYLLKLFYTTLEKKNTKKVLQIHNVNEFDNFTFKYGCKPSSVINWSAVEKDFGGIEIIPMINERHGTMSSVPDKIKSEYQNRGFDFNLFWYYGFDVPSGCVWNSECIKRIDLIKK